MSRKKSRKKVFFKQSEVGGEMRSPGFSSLMRPENKAKRHYWRNTKDSGRPKPGHLSVLVSLLFTTIRYRLISFGLRAIFALDITSKKLRD